ncbi:MAG: hypothetical protein DBX59_05765 [Bacillota bacterium]|nr:MAG: hypothetical protein DBX59_05765 [Bacillota bacterium]
MTSYLEFKNAECRDCYKCLRFCPVKAIEVVNHQARIIESRCILCGKCTEVCPQNAKRVHTELDEVKRLLSSSRVVASVAPSFVSSFETEEFSVMKIALGKLGFADAEETATGARMVTAEYEKLLKMGKYKNLITSACPAVDRMIQMYYPDALKYLAPVDSPMVAHAKMLKAAGAEKVVFIGPCIAKKREGNESGVVDGVLTFEDLKTLFSENGVELANIARLKSAESGGVNRAKYYPISRGIIKSFDKYVDGYEYVAVDGADKCREVLENIDSLSGMFLELNSCEYACVNGPCSLIKKGSAVKANAAIRKYTNKDIEGGLSAVAAAPAGVDFAHEYARIRPNDRIPSEREIAEILARTGKTEKKDELNCGACGYNSCREKACAVANGYAELDMCLPYMRERAESMSYEIIQSSPNGIILLDNEFNITEINQKAKEIFGISEKDVKGRAAFDFINPTEFVLAQEEGKNVHNKRIKIEKTGKTIELSVILLKKQKVLYGVMKDITEEADYDEKLNAVKLETLSTTDEVIKKQMRVAQEIASLLGETTAETKVALLKLKKTLQEGGAEEK